MATSWNAQIGGGKYCLRFETTDYEKYREVEKTAQRMIDEANKEIEKQRGKMFLKEVDKCV